MKDTQLFESNRTAWNEALEYHQKARGNSLQSGFSKPDFTTFERDCDAVLIKKLDEIGLCGKTIAQMPCNNGRELLSLMRFGAKEAVGFDISDSAIEEARRLAAISGLNARFERVNILDLARSEDHEQRESPDLGGLNVQNYDNCFDFIYVSEGSLQWFPDLDAYFSVIRRVLKQNGTLLVFEMHPFAYFFENGFESERPDFETLTPYFEKGPYHYENGLDYIGGERYETKDGYWFMHTLSDILNAMLRNGIALQSFEEYNLEMANNAATKLMDKFPLSYILTGGRAAR